MPPKADPYAAPLHRRIDTFLCVFSLILAAVVFFVAAHWSARTRGLFILGCGICVCPFRATPTSSDHCRASIPACRPRRM